MKALGTLSLLGCAGWLLAAFALADSAHTLEDMGYAIGAAALSLLLAFVGSTLLTRSM